MITALVAAAAASCATCHPDVAAQWSQSAHRFASFNNPYYAVSARQFAWPAPDSKNVGLTSSRMSRTAPVFASAMRSCSRL